MIVTLLICAMATLPQDCNAQNAVRGPIMLPIHPVTCSLNTGMAILAENADLWDPKIEYPSIICQQGVRA